MAKSDEVLTSRQVADICNVASRTVQKWFDTGLLGGYRMPGSKTRRIPTADLVNFLNKYNMPIPQKLLQHTGKKHASKKIAGNLPSPRARKPASTARKINIVSLAPKPESTKKTTSTRKKT